MPLTAIKKITLVVCIVMMFTFSSAFSPAEKPKEASGGFFAGLESLFYQVVFGADIRSPEKAVLGEMVDVDLEEKDEIRFEKPVPPDIQIIVDRIENELPKPPPPKKSYTILIYHTHNDEAYTKEEAQVYKESTPQRTYNNDFNVVHIGDVLAKKLTEMGFTVVHDKTDNVSAGFYTAYNRSLKLLEKQVKEHGAFDLAIDLHRDAYNPRTHNTVEVAGETSARMMFVIGTAKGDENTTFKVKPDWEYNLSIANALAGYMNEKAEGLCKKTNVKTNRYNQHVNRGSVLIEVGNNYNTLGEAENAILHFAGALQKYFYQT